LVTGNPLGRLPFVSAHLASLDLGVRYLDRHCPEAGFEICRFRDHLPMAWTSFLFGAAPGIPTDAQTRKRLSDEQFQFAAAVFMDRPAATIVTAASEGLRQLAMFSYDDLNQREKRPFWRLTLPPRLVQAIADSRFWGNPHIFAVMSWTEQAIAVASALILPGVLWGLAFGRAPSSRQFFGFICGVGLGIIVNAFVCGVLASPYDRFQVRVVWLIPFMAVTGVLFLRQKLTNGPDHHCHSPNSAKI
jgi:hypothetical protein